MASLTHEQAAVVACQAPVLAVNAFAGTGKTHTLREYARARAGKKILYLAFNKSVAQEAIQKMPSNVAVKTSHSLAWGKIASYWPSAKLSGRSTSWTLLNASPTERLFQQKNLATTRANFALECVRMFTQSPALSLGEFMQDVTEASLAEANLDAREASDLVARVWARMCDPSDPLPATHDTYFKLWQLSRPKLGNYDIILLDEAQDTNPALFDVFMLQRHAGRVLVGDKHQNIYVFRGAMNAMERIAEPHEALALTHSFRFGQPVADVANLILGEFKGERRALTGAASGPCEVSSKNVPPSTSPTAFLFRTNAGLFEAAANLCQKTDIGLLGKFQDYAFDDILDTHRLMVGKTSEIKNPYLRSFGSFSRLKEHAELVDDKDLKMRVKVIDTYGHEIPKLHRMISERIVDKADLTLTTAHKSKGAEWSQVVLGSDFPDLCGSNGVPLSRRRLGSNATKAGIRPLEAGEANLWYVSATRAQNHLVTNEQLRDLMDFAKKERAAA